MSLTGLFWPTSRSETNAMSSCNCIQGCGHCSFSWSPQKLQDVAAAIKQILLREQHTCGFSLNSKSLLSNAGVVWNLVEGQAIQTESLRSDSHLSSKGSLTTFCKRFQCPWNTHVLTQVKQWEQKKHAPSGYEQNLIWRGPLTKPEMQWSSRAHFGGGLCAPRIPGPCRKLSFRRVPKEPLQNANTTHVRVTRTTHIAFLVHESD